MILYDIEWAVFQYPLFTVGSKWGDLIPAMGNKSILSRVSLFLSFQAEFIVSYAMKRPSSWYTSYHCESLFNNLISFMDKYNCVKNNKKGES